MRRGPVSRPVQVLQHPHLALEPLHREPEVSDRVLSSGFFPRLLGKFEGAFAAMATSSSPAGTGDLGANGGLSLLRRTR